jgi:hypothetical protein
MVCVTTLFESETVTSSCRIAAVANPDPQARFGGMVHDAAV